jgi:hypothetical protein
MGDWHVVSEVCLHGWPLHHVDRHLSCLHPQEVDELEAAGRMEEAAKLANEKVEAQLQQVSIQAVAGGCHSTK